MSANTAIYGHSRGYRLLGWLSFLAFLFSFTLTVNKPGINGITAAGTLGFAILSWYALRRGSRRTEVMRITDGGFAITDPAQSFGTIRYEEIEELRIYALRTHPTIGFRLAEPDRIRRRGPAVLRVMIKPIWKFRHYQIVLELDQFNDQVAAIKSVAVRAGIPIRTELL